MELSNAALLVKFVVIESTPQFGSQNQTMPFFKESGFEVLVLQSIGKDDSFDGYFG